MTTDAEPTGPGKAGCKARHPRPATTDLDARCRALITDLQIRATWRTGAIRSDVREVFQHVAIHAGVPRANHALKIARGRAAVRATRGD